MKAAERRIFRAFAINAGVNYLRVLYGSNSHHMTEALFKATARALRALTIMDNKLPSTKGL